MSVPVRLCNDMNHPLRVYVAIVKGKKKKIENEQFSLSFTEMLGDKILAESFGYTR